MSYLVKPKEWVRENQLISKLVKFGIVGLTSVGIYFICLILLDLLFEETVILVTAAYILSMGANFILQTFFTFGKKSIESSSVFKYVVMHILLMTLNSAAMVLLVDVFEFPLYISQFFVTGTVAATSFLLSYIWVYR